MKTFFTILTALVAAAAASPLHAEEIIRNGNVTSFETYPNGLPDGLYPGVAARDVDLQKRADSGVYNLDGDLNDQVSSVGPDAPHYCFFFSNYNCNDNEGHIGMFSPGAPDLTASNWGFDDKISSWSCNPS
ncbi:hypothetical protein B9Z65_8357 [Elsinoe australis]|uniref:Uncharacterized protein n=1 Tax=Elsinoe australis TaxID=40998 RepID=A0A2P7YDJ0_9PEZI|nr:hypothetical protein B9Z65_8357 [Elsinoe australis]